MNKEKSILDDLKTDDKGRYILPLLKEVIYGGDTIKELILEEPKAKHIREMPSNPKTDDILKIIGKLCTQADSVIDELSLKDVTRVSEFIESFS